MNTRPELIKAAEDRFATFPFAYVVVSSANEWVSTDEDGATKLTKDIVLQSNTPARLHVHALFTVKFDSLGAIKRAYVDTDASDDLLSMKLSPEMESKLIAHGYTVINHQFSLQGDLKEARIKDPEFWDQEVRPYITAYLDSKEKEFQRREDELKVDVLWLRLSKMFPALLVREGERHLHILERFGFIPPGSDIRAGLSRTPVSATVPEISLCSVFRGSFNNILDGYNQHEVLDLIQLRCPDFWKRALPRKYQVPSGFGQPKDLAIIGFTAALSEQQGFALKDGQVDQGGVLTYLTTAALLNHGVPLYFLSAPLTEALLQTDLPDGLALSDVKWPLDSFLVSIPDNILKDKQGHKITLLGISRVKAGETYRMFPESVDPGVVAPADALVTFAYSVDGILCWHHPIADESVKLGLEDKYLNYTGGQITEEGDPDNVTFSRDCRRLAIQVLLAMVARPDLVEEGVEARPAKIKRGVVIHDAVWHPNFIGRQYRSKYETGEGGSSDEKVRTHWRRGHFRQYRKSSGFKEDKIIWLEPMLINAPQ